MQWRSTKIEGAGRTLSGWSRALALPLALGVGADLVQAADLDAATGFKALTGLAGAWTGSTGSPDGPATKVGYRLTSGGHTVMETLFGGGSHEMISMYHIDHDDLVITHYCAMGNQPRMKLDRAGSSADTLVFKFDGGSNLDPAKDMHIHEGRIHLADAGRMEAEWVIFEGPKAIATNKFYLHRAADAAK